MKVVALVGMPGSGKSEVAKVFAAAGYRVIRFGDITDDEVKKRGLDLNESNEKVVREGLRAQYGMAAYAMLNLPRILDALKAGNAVLDGLYSWEEYKYLAEKLGDKLEIVSVWAPPRLRYHRLRERKVRPLTPDQARARDFAEIENVNKGGPIAMADHMVNNDSTLESLVGQSNDIIRKIG
jgi:dephospho-CoA kinase